MKNVFPSLEDICFLPALVLLVSIAFTCLFLSPAIILAEEGGSGHYLPGSMASFVDAVPPEETFIVRFNLLNYQGSAGKNVRIPIGGLSTFDADVDSWGYGLTFLWRPPLDLGDQWSYALSATIPMCKWRSPPR